MGLEIENLHNVNETLVSVCHCGTKKIKAGRQTANINTIKTLEVSPRKGPLFSDTSKKINK